MHTWDVSYSCETEIYKINWIFEMLLWKKYITETISDESKVQKFSNVLQRNLYLHLYKILWKTNILNKLSSYQILHKWHFKTNSAKMHLSKTDSFKLAFKLCRKN